MIYRRVVPCSNATANTTASNSITARLTPNHHRQHTSITTTSPRSFVPFCISSSHHQHNINIHDAANKQQRRVKPRFAFLIGILLFTFIMTLNISTLSFKKRHRKKFNLGHTVNGVYLPKELLNSVYHDVDFVNEKGITPPYWTLGQNSTTFGTVPSHFTWGPCFPPSRNIHWKEYIRKYQYKRSKRPNTDDSTKWFEYTPSKFSMKRKISGLSSSRMTNAKNSTLVLITSSSPTTAEQQSLSGFCRPGFLIIGAGKCGTSSLYHYLVGHPRVAPAKAKQIHYFKYFADRPMTWYLSHFPTTTSFLAAGALMTGEASPGYLPYPDVAQLVASRFLTHASDTGGTGGGPKIIVVGRNPLERIVSSYLYNYIGPAIVLIKKGAFDHIALPTNLTRDTDYIPYLFSLEDLLRAELVQLQRCLSEAVNNASAVGSSSQEYKWSQQSWARRTETSHNSDLPLVDVDGHCYGKRYDAKTPRRQWKSLVKQHPNKIIRLPHLHLIQALLGRSLYVLPLEWWYRVFPPNDIYFVCTEELRDKSGESMNQVGQFLGLPRFNFSTIVQRGLYNVGGHQGYDTATSWEQAETERNRGLNGEGIVEATNSSSSSLMNAQTTTFASLLALSDSFRDELQQFIKPFNERLFRLIGRRCNW